MEGLQERVLDAEIGECQIAEMKTRPVEGHLGDGPEGDSLVNLLGEVEHADVAALEHGFIAAHMLLERPLKVDGLCSLSIFDGSGGMSVSLALSGVPTVGPWEVDRGQMLDVIKNAVIL